MSKSFIMQFGSESMEGGLLQIVWEAHQEDMHFVHELDDPELLDEVERGVFELFAVRAVVKACGVELGDVWLGGCIHSSFEAFLEETGEADEMRESLRGIARLKLAELADLHDSLEGTS